MLGVGAAFITDDILSKNICSNKPVRVSCVCMYVVATTCIHIILYSVLVLKCCSVC